MKKIIIIIYLVVINSLCVVAQDTLGNFYYNGFTDGDLFFAKQFQNKNNFYTIALNSNKVVVQKNYLDSNSSEIFEIEFETSVREVRNAFLTDTSFIFLLRNKEKDANTLKYEFCFTIDSFIKTPLQIDAFTNNTTIAYKVESNKMFFYQKDMKKNLLMFTIADCNGVLKTCEFSINELIKQSGLKKGKFENAFMNNKTIINSNNEKNLMVVAGKHKCYFLNDKAYLISNEADDNAINVLRFDLLNLKANYYEISTKNLSCSQKHNRLRKSFSLFNDKIVGSVICKHNSELSFYNADNALLIKHFNTDTSFDNVPKNQRSFLFNVEKSTNTKNESIKKEIYDKVDYLETYSDFTKCIAIDSNHVMVISGLLKKPNVGIATMLTAMSITMSIMSVGNHFLSPTNYFPTSTAFDVARWFELKSKDVLQVNYIVNYFNSDLTETADHLQSPFDSVQKRIVKNRAKTLTTFRFNNFEYDVNFIKASDNYIQLTVVKQ